jgi:hypothetical protein
VPELDYRNRQIRHDCVLIFLSPKNARRARTACQFLEFNMLLPTTEKPGFKEETGLEERIQLYLE